jgi:hypothetical protein
LFQKGEKIKHFIENQQKSYLYTDYGNLSFEDRKNLIANDTYYLDKDFLEENFVFYRRYKITGSHEFTVNKILMNIM